MQATDWIEWLAVATSSTTSMCLKIVDPAFLALDDAAKAVQGSGEPDRGRGRRLRLQRLPLGPGGLRIWGGSTVETANIEALLPWLAVFRRQTEETIKTWNRSMSANPKS